MHCACVLEPWSALQWSVFITRAMRCLWTLSTSSCTWSLKARLLSFSDHPALSITEDCWQERFRDSPGFCLFNMFTKTEVDHSVFTAAPVRIPNIPPWSIQKPVIDLTFLRFVRQTASAFVALVFSSHLHNIYDQFVKIYTDGSKTSARAGCGIYIADRNLRYSITINKFFSSITSELFAILHALYLAYSLNIIKVVGVTDSLSSLQSITNWNWKKHSYANKIALLYSPLSASGYEVRFLWVPGHQNIPGPKHPWKWNSWSIGKTLHCQTIIQSTQMCSLQTGKYPTEFYWYAAISVQPLFPRVGNSIPDRHKKKCIQSYLSCPATVLSVDPLPLYYNLLSVHRSLSTKPSYVTYWSSFW